MSYIFRRGKEIIEVACELVEVDKAQFETEAAKRRGNRRPASARRGVKAGSTPTSSSFPETEHRPEGRIASDSTTAAWQAADPPEEVDTDNDVDPARPDLGAARRILNEYGVRKFCLPTGELIIAIWSDLDCVEIRAALRAIRADVYPVRYLDGPEVPVEYKGRSVPGEPVPKNVLAAMLETPQAPWVVRDRMLRKMHWTPNGISPEQFLVEHVTRETERIAANAKPDVTAEPKSERTTCATKPAGSTEAATSGLLWQNRQLLLGEQRSTFRRYQPRKSSIGREATGF
jgi:hypothetical protein